MFDFNDNTDGVYLNYASGDFVLGKEIGGVSYEATVTKVLVGGTTYAISCDFSSTSGVTLTVDASTNNNANTGDVTSTATGFVGSNSTASQIAGDIQEFKVTPL